MKKFVIGVSLCFLFFVLIPLGIVITLYLTKPIEVHSEFSVLNGEVVVTLHISDNAIDPVCVVNHMEMKAENHQCVFTSLNEETTVAIHSKFQDTTYTYHPNINQVLDFILSKTQYYLAVGGRENVLVSISKLGSPDETMSLSSSNEGVLRVEGSTLVGVSPGNATVTVFIGGIRKEISVVVTDLIQLPVVDKKKRDLPCNIYSAEQNQLLDTILESKVQDAGYGTRAGVVAALRFLTLEFPYQINYFYENGRLNNNTGGDYVDGEGRFYHKGLYLHSSKYSVLKKVGYGPAIWGCPLVNWQDESGFVRGVKYPNGLDCSGFITWAMYNGGFDPGDTGAGENAWTDDDLSDLGVHQYITRSLLESNTIKAGDLIGTNGHIAMVGGIKDGIIYVAESTTYYDGVVMYPYTYRELLSSPYLTYVINMDDYYKNDGNYTAYWE